MALESPWVCSELAVKLTETALRLHCKPMETAVRLWQMHGDCAANHSILMEMTYLIVLEQISFFKIMSNGKLN